MGLRFDGWNKQICELMEGSHCKLYYLSIYPFTALESHSCRWRIKSQRTAGIEPANWFALCVGIVSLLWLEEEKETVCALVLKGKPHVNVGRVRRNSPLIAWVISFAGGKLSTSFRADT
jgi:hypothetical protein